MTPINWSFFCSTYNVMAHLLPAGTRFEVPANGKKKYTAIIPLAGGKSRRVGFGHRDYQQYADQVPVGLGGGRWTHKNHYDEARRKSYRARHGGILCKGVPCIGLAYSPAWFSYHYLW